MTSVLRYRKKWFLWVGAHGVLYAIMLPRIAELFPERTGGFPVTPVFAGISLLALASGLLIFRDPARMHLQNLERRPGTDLASTANIFGKLTFAILITPMSAGVVDAIVSGRNHAPLFLGMAAVGAAVYWIRLGSALQTLDNLPKRAKRRPKS